MSDRQLPKNHTVRYKHNRDVKTVYPGKLASYVALNERGGATFAFVRDRHGKVVSVGIALCRSDETDDDGRVLVRGDQFNSRLGRTIALGRALKALEEGDGGLHSVVDSDLIEALCDGMDVPYVVGS